MVKKKLVKEMRSFKLISAYVLCNEFGSSSILYPYIKEKLQNLWEEIGEGKNKKEIFDHWINKFKILYGYQPPFELFLDHTYLIILAKSILYLRLNDRRAYKNDTIKVLNGNYFLNEGIINFLEEDYSRWLINPKIKIKSINLIFNIIRKLSDYDISNIDEDIFNGIYEELVARKERHKAGEYYTPEWLVQIILDDVIDLWEEKKYKSYPKILDPACGSGTFLYYAIKILRKKLKENVIRYVMGIDINPISSIIAKTNFLIAMGDSIKKLEKIKIPIYTKDCLKFSETTNHNVETYKYDIIIGNPPWIVMRTIKNKDYQNFLKKEVLKYQLLENKDTHLFTQIDLSTLFFCKCADLYLKDEGIIAFIMPRSVLGGAIHHNNFRKFQRPYVKLVKIIDLDDAKPLFNMPSCVLIGFKGGITKYPVSLKKFSVELFNRNEKLSEIKTRLSVKKHKYTPVKFSKKPSYYYDKFKVGASIFPRAFYFIDFVKIKNSLLVAKTSNDILRIVKYPWKVELKGSIEPEFIYATLLSWEMLPFGYRKLRPIILPIKEKQNKYEPVDIDEINKYGFNGIEKWLKSAQKIWDKKKTEKAKVRFPRLINRLDYNGLLSCQNSKKKFIVLYNATGTNVTSCVINKHLVRKFEVNKRVLELKGFIVDVKTWFFETDNELNAHYLSTLLNSDIINKMIKPLQPRGLFGARAIHRRPLLFPIPKFDKNKKLHIELARIGKKCQEKVKVLHFPTKNNIKLAVKKELNTEIEKINKIVTKLLNVEG